MQRFAPIYIKGAPISLIQAILSQTGLLIFRKLLKPQLKYRAPWQTLISPITSVATFDYNQLKNIPRKAGPDKNEKQVYLLTQRRENILIFMLPSQQKLDKKAKLMQFSKLSQKWFLENNFLGLRSTAAMTTLLLAGQADQKCISKAILLI